MRYSYPEMRSDPPEQSITGPNPSGGWDAHLYDDKHAFVWSMSSDLVDMLAPQPGEGVLDLGCGTGHLTAKIAECGAVTLGIDSAESMVRHAQQRYPRLRFETGDALTMDFDQQFDAIFSNAVLHWIRPPEEAARRMHRALKPGGRLVAELGTHGNVRRLVDAITAAREAVTSAAPPRRGAVVLSHAGPVLLSFGASWSGRDLCLGVRPAHAA